MMIDREYAIHLLYNVKSALYAACLVRAITADALEVKLLKDSNSISICDIKDSIFLLIVKSLKEPVNFTSTQDISTIC